MGLHMIRFSDFFLVIIIITIIFIAIIDNTNSNINTRFTNKTVALHTLGSLQSLP